MLPDGARLRRSVTAKMSKTSSAVPSIWSYKPAAGIFANGKRGKHARRVVPYRIDDVELRFILPVDDSRPGEGPRYLDHHVRRNFGPGKLPEHRERECDGWIQVSAADPSRHIDTQRYADAPGKVMFVKPPFTISPVWPWPNSTTIATTPFPNASSTMVPMNSATNSAVRENFVIYRRENNKLENEIWTGGSYPPAGYPETSGRVPQSKERN